MDDLKKKLFLSPFFYIFDRTIGIRTVSNCEGIIGKNLSGVLKKQFSGASHFKQVLQWFLKYLFGFDVKSPDNVINSRTYYVGWSKFSPSNGA